MPEAASARLGLIAPSDAGDALTIWPDQAQAIIATLDTKTAIFGTGGRSSRPRSTPGNQGISGQVYRSTGDGGIDYDTGTSWVTVKPGLFTSLPTLSGHASDGIDEGMEILFQTAGMAAVGVPPYRLRYENVGGATKWAVLSARPWTVKTLAAVTLSGTGPSDVGPTIALPATGDWLCEFGAAVLVLTGGATIEMGLTATGLAYQDDGYVQISGPANMRVPAWRATRIDGIGGTLKIRYSNSSASAGQGDMFVLSATPVRL